MNIYSKIITALGCLPLVFGIALYIIFYRAVNTLGRLPIINNDKVADFIPKFSLIFIYQLYKFSITAIIVCVLLIILNKLFFKKKISRFVTLSLAIGFTSLLIIAIIDPFGAFNWIIGI